MRHLRAVLLIALSCGTATGVPAGFDAGPTRTIAPADGGALPAFDASHTGDAGRDAAVPIDAGPALTIEEQWAPKVIYMAMTDRFYNGDPTNDHAGMPDCFDAAHPKGTHGGDLAGLRQKRAYLSELGVSALWITPVNAQASKCGSYHGYWADFVDPNDMAIAPTLGNAQDLDGLIDELHGAGMLFMLDMVVNHAGLNARIVSQHPDWFHDEATCTALGDATVFCPLSHLPDFAQENPAVATYLTSVTAAWESRFSIDAIRMDTAKHVPIPYWKASWFPAVQGLRKNLFTVGEVYDESGAAALAPFLDAGFPSLFNYPLYAALIDTFARGASLDLVADKINDDVGTLGIARTRMLTTFLGNHDQPRFASQAAGAAADEMARRLRLAMVALFTLPGIPQLYYGDELGFIGTTNRADMPAWAWSNTTRAGSHAPDALPDADVTFEWTRKLIATRTAHPALFGGSYDELWRPNGNATNVMVFFRAAGNDRVMVAINDGNADSGPISILTKSNTVLSPADRAALANGVILTDLLGGGAPPTVAVQDGKAIVDLPAKSAAIYLVP